jgi:hypothetical protein
MSKPETGPDARADKDWGLQFIAGFILMSGIALAVFGLVVMPAIEVMDDNGGTVTVTSDLARAPEIKAIVPSDAEIQGADLSSASDELQLRVQSLPTGLRLLAGAPVSWLTLCLLVAAWMLFGLLRSIGQGRPFDPRNARRLSVLAALTIAGTLVFRAIESLAASAVLDHLGLSGGNLQPLGIWVLWPFAVAVLLAALARAFRYGGQLQDDVAGMV